MSMREHLNRMSGTAAGLAHSRRPEYKGGPGYGAPEGAVNARVAAVIYADVRDAMDVRAPWLNDRIQLAQYLTHAHNAAREAGFTVTDGPSLAAMIIDELDKTPV